MKAITGHMPSSEVFPIEVGHPQGRHVPYVAPDTKAKVAYAGVGVLKGDTTHFAPDAWSPKPLTLQEAFHEARLRAWLESVLDEGAK